MQISGKVFVLTGAGSGIGRALAGALSTKGAKLVLCDLNEDGLKETQGTLANPDNSTLCVGDITDAQVRAKIAKTCEDTYGGLDVLVNNAGVVAVGPLADADDTMLDLMVRVNLLAPMQLTRDLMDLLEKSQTPKIVNTGSMFGDIAFPLFAGYSATKFGVRGLSDALRRELAPKGIHVTYVAPRAAKTGATHAFEHLIEPMQMKLDEPYVVAANIVQSIENDARSAYPKGMERLFVFIQRVFPKIIDNAIIKQLNSLHH